MGGRFKRRLAVGLAVFVGAGVLAVGMASAAPPEPYFFFHDDVSFSEGDAVDPDSGSHYDAYRMRITVDPVEHEDDDQQVALHATSVDYLVGLQAQQQGTLCAYPEPLDPADPTRGGDGCDSTFFDEESGFHNANLFLEADVPSTFCLTVVAFADEDIEGDGSYLVGGFEDEDAGTFTAQEIPPIAGCGETTLVANPALLDVELSGIQLPLGTVIAQLTSHGTPVAGKPISFIGGTGLPICSAVTDANGFAACSNLLGVLAAGGSYGAFFAGDDTYDASVGRGPWIKALGIRLF